MAEEVDSAGNCELGKGHGEYLPLKLAVLQSSMSRPISDPCGGRRLFGRSNNANTYYSPIATNTSILSLVDLVHRDSVDRECIFTSTIY